MVGNVFRRNQGATCNHDDYQAVPGFGMQNGFSLSTREIFLKQNPRRNHLRPGNGASIAVTQARSMAELTFCDKQAMETLSSYGWILYTLFFIIVNHYFLRPIRMPQIHCFRASQPYS